MGLILLIVLIVLLFGEFDWGYHGLIVVVGVRHCFTALKTFLVFSRLSATQNRSARFDCTVSFFDRITYSLNFFNFATLTLLSCH